LRRVAQARIRAFHPLAAKKFPVEIHGFLISNLPRVLNVICFLLPMKMEQTECSETSAYKIQTPGNYPEESIQHS